MRPSTVIVRTGLGFAGAEGCLLISGISWCTNAACSSRVSSDFPSPLLARPSEQISCLLHEKQVILHGVLFHPLQAQCNAAKVCWSHRVTLQITEYLTRVGRRRCTAPRRLRANLSVKALSKKGFAKNCRRSRRFLAFQSGNLSATTTMLLFSAHQGVTFRSAKWAIVPCPTQSAIPPLDKGCLRSLTIRVGCSAPLT